VTSALRFAREARHLVSLLEQPVPADDLDAMAAVTRESPLPVFADESVQDVSDALRIAAKGAANGLNVKLMKLGGLAACRDVAAIARAAGLDVMVGCMDETALTVGAAAALACGMPGRVHADLDGDLDLLDDPYVGRVVREAGWLRPSWG
jgi:L-alanine-DL-glutamate epimerase-like enolase superfamily enzyme